jgi:hypothetical protein
MKMVVGFFLLVSLSFQTSDAHAFAAKRLAGMQPLKVRESILRCDVSSLRALLHQSPSLATAVPDCGAKDGCARAEGEADLRLCYDYCEADTQQGALTAPIRTAMWGCSDAQAQAEIVELLLKFGARVNERASIGHPVLLSAPSEAIALQLIRAGAKEKCEAFYWYQHNGYPEHGEVWDKCGGQRTCSPKILSKYPGCSVRTTISDEMQAHHPEWTQAIDEFAKNQLSAAAR